MLNVIRQHRELIWNLATRELKIRYRGSALGFLWTLLIPLFMAAIYIFFLHLLGGKGVPLTEVIIGVFAWQFTVQCVNSGLGAITGNVNLVKKVYFPRFILPLSATLANLINYLLSLVVQFPVLFVMMYIKHQPVSGLLWLFPLVICCQLVFNFGLALLMASVNVYYRDLQHLVGVLLSAWFFVTPVMYNLFFVEHFAEKHPWLMPLYMLNPMAVIITAYRAVCIESVAFPLTASVWISAAATVALVVASYAISSASKKTSPIFSDENHAANF